MTTREELLTLSPVFILILLLGFLAYARIKYGAATSDE